MLGRTDYLIMSVNFSFNFMLPTRTVTSSFDGSTPKTVAFFPKEETYTVSPTVGNSGSSVMIRTKLKRYGNEKLP